MSVDLRQPLADLRALIGLLKKRCLEAEARAEDLQRQLDEQKARMQQLEAEKAELETKYHNLQLGLTASGSNAEQIAQLKEQYLAMVSEIDACIDKLQHG